MVSMETFTQMDAFLQIFSRISKSFPKLLIETLIEVEILMDSARVQSINGEEVIIHY